MLVYTSQFKHRIQSSQFVVITDTSHNSIKHDHCYFQNYYCLKDDNDQITVTGQSNKNVTNKILTTNFIITSVIYNDILLLGWPI